MDEKEKQLTEETIELKKKLLALEQDITKTHAAGVKPTEEQTKNVEKTNKSLTSLNRTLKDTVELAKTTAGIWAEFRILDNFSGAIKSLVKMNSELHRTAINAGLGADGVKKVQAQVQTLQIELGATHDQAAKIVSTLTEGTFQGSLDKMSRSVFAFSKSTNMSQEAVAELSIQLSKAGKLSDDAITAAYADIVKVQQANGISTKGMQALTAQIGKSAENMRLFGKSDIQIKTMIGSTAKLVSAMEKVGVAAETTTDLIDRMTNPERIEENIALYAQMGISMSDALSGNIDPERVGQGMKDIGTKLKSMGAVAGAAYAKAIGVSYRDAIKAADADLSEMNKVDLTPEEKGQQALQEAMKATMDTTERVQAFINSITGQIEKLGPVLLTALFVAGAALAKLMNGTEETVSKTVQKTTDGVKKKISDIKFDDLEKNLNMTLTSTEKDFLKSVQEYEKQVSSLSDLNQQKLRAESIGRKDLVETIQNQINALEKSSTELLDKLGGVENAADATFKDRTVEILENVVAEYDTTNIEKLYYRMGENVDKNIQAHKDANNAIFTQEMKLLDARTKLKDSLSVSKAKAEEASNAFSKRVLSKLDKWNPVNAVRSIGKNLENYVVLGGTKAAGVMRSAANIANTVIGGAKGVIKALNERKEKKQQRREEKAAKKEAGGGMSGMMGKLGKVAAVMGGVAMAVGVLIAIMKKNEQFQKLLEDVMSTATQMLQDLVSGIDIEGITNTFKSIVAAVKPIFRDVLKPLFDALMKLVVPVLTLIGTLLVFLTPVLTFVSKIIVKLVGVIEWLVKAITNIFKKSKDSFETNTAELISSNEANTEATEANTSKGEQLSISSNGDVRTTGLNASVSAPAVSSTMASTTESTPQRQEQESSSKSQAANKDYSADLAALRALLERMNAAFSNNDMAEKQQRVTERIANRLESGIKVNVDSSMVNNFLSEGSVG